MSKNKIVIVLLLVLLNVIVNVDLVAFNTIYLFCYLLIKIICKGINFYHVINAYLVLFFLGCVIEVWLRL